MKGIDHPDGNPGGLSLEVKLGEAIVLTFGGIQAEITVTGVKKVTPLAQLLVRAPREIKIDRKNWKPKA